MTAPLHPPPPPLPAGLRLREFELRGVLGHGGFGIVYLADDTLLHRRVALKEYFPPSLALRGADGRQVAPPPASVARFQTGLHAFMREARLLAQFDHPGLVPVHHYWEAHGTAYLVMPYIEGATLKDICRSLDGPPDEAWLRRVLDGLLDTLAAMHAAHVYHRDVSPDNVIIGSDGAPVLLDLGAAREVRPDGTQTITALLKPSYAPIEQYAHDRELRQGPWTDLYAVAATLCFALTGKAPPTAAARAVRDLHRPLAEREELRAAYDPRWLSALDAALAVRPDDRPRSIDAFRALMGPLTGDLPQRAKTGRQRTQDLTTWRLDQAASPAATGDDTVTAGLDAGLGSRANRGTPRLRQRWLAAADGPQTRSLPTGPFTRGGWARRWALLGATALMALLIQPNLTGPSASQAGAGAVLADARPDLRAEASAGAKTTGTTRATEGSTVADLLRSLAPGESLAERRPDAQTLPLAGADRVHGAGEAASIAVQDAAAAASATAAVSSPAMPVAAAETPPPDAGVAAATVADMSPATATAPVATKAAAKANAASARHAGRGGASGNGTGDEARRVSVASAAPAQRCAGEGFFSGWRCMAQACSEPRWTRSETCRTWRGDDRLQAMQYRN